MSGYVGRLAPSPTGALHLGNVRTFMIAWLRARSRGGEVILRMEDLDHPKDKPGADVQAIEDLRWLGFDWDREYVQSQRKGIYRQALEALQHPTSPQNPQTHNSSSPSSPSNPKTSKPQNHPPLVYPCVCSRRDVEAAQSAPHAGEQLHYPGTCCGRFATWAEAFAYKTSHPSHPSHTSHTSHPLPCWRFAVAPNTVVAFDDVFAGHYEQDVSKTLGDFPIARDEFGAGYTLACAVDDLLMGVTEVVRGDDLLAATPAQILLARALIGSSDWEGRALSRPTRRSALPKYLHVPLVVGRDGKRLAKRHGDTRVAFFREQGKTPEEILGILAASCGWAAKGERISLRDLVPRFDLATIPHAPFMV